MLAGSNLWRPYFHLGGTTMSQQLPESKHTYLIMGVANERSIGWAVAQKFSSLGASVILTSGSERSQRKTAKLAASLASKHVEVRCDVIDPQNIGVLFNRLAKECGSLTGVVHCIGRGSSLDLQRPVHRASMEGYNATNVVSVYSLIATASYALPLMTDGGSIVTISYIGSERVVPGYGIMGIAKAGLEACVRHLAYELGRHRIRVNAVSSGPISTLSAQSLPNFYKTLDASVERSPLERSVTSDEVAQAVYFLASDQSSGITGEVLHVDAGFHIMA